MNANHKHYKIGLRWSPQKTDYDILLAAQWLVERHETLQKQKWEWTGTWDEDEQEFRLGLMALTGHGEVGERCVNDDTMLCEQERWEDYFYFVEKEDTWDPSLC